ncbi:hypothetical protein [Sphingomonas sp. MM-1]|uniref:hypothetical protein n=1 Tax=Sphingomonas sp. MM-1 TaxID=745310 RepID=UPI0016513440|nr:hypothetical protein [Sphingomonas sp. MM-1]
MLAAFVSPSSALPTSTATMFRISSSICCVASKRGSRRPGGRPRGLLLTPGCHAGLPGPRGSIGIGGGVGFQSTSQAPRKTGSAMIDRTWPGIRPPSIPADRIIRTIAGKRRGPHPSYIESSGYVVMSAAMDRAGRAHVRTRRGRSLS